MADTTALDIAEVAEAASDPEKLVVFLEKIQPLIQEFGDEDGDKFRVFDVNDTKSAEAFLKIPPPVMKMGMGIKDVRPISVRDDDVMLISYPKTGTHWTCNLLRFMLMKGPLEDQTSFQPPLIDLFATSNLEAMASPRVLTTHLTPSLVPRELFQGKGKMILIYRNPKDTAVSHYHHMCRMTVFGTPMKMSWNTFVDGWMKGLVPPGLYTKYYNTWQKTIEDKKDDVKFLTVCYEDLKKEPLREARRMSEYLGLSNSDERLQQILDKCSINNLRSDVNDGKVKSPLVDEQGKSVLYRKGVVGDWKSHFTVEQSETMDVILSDQFADTIFKPKY